MQGPAIDKQLTLTGFYKHCPWKQNGKKATNVAPLLCAPFHNGNCEFATPGLKDIQGRGKLVLDSFNSLVTLEFVHYKFAPFLVCNVHGQLPIRISGKDNMWTTVDYGCRLDSRTPDIITGQDRN